jgi:hypothetical protein
MTFTSWQFGVFVAVVFGAYYFPPLRTLQIQLLVFASLFFYGYGQPELLPLLAVAVLGTYLTLILALRDRRVWLPIGIGFNLALLAFFKYKLLFVDPTSAGFDRRRANRLPSETAAADRNFILRIPQRQSVGRSHQAEKCGPRSGERLPLHHIRSLFRDQSRVPKCSCRRSSRSIS